MSASGAVDGVADVVVGLFRLRDVGSGKRPPRWARGGQGNTRKPPKEWSVAKRPNQPISGQNAEQPKAAASNGAES